MGQYLKDAYEERELAKTLAKVHGIIDEETQKLSDKLKNLTLSHNRKKKALLKIKDSLEWESRKRCRGGVDWCFFHVLIEICERALWSDGRFNIK